MLPEQVAVLKQIGDYAEENAVDAVVIAGDVYDRSVPPAEAVEVLDAFLHRLYSRYIPVLMVAGNHDSPERLGFGGRIFAERGIYIAGTYDGTVLQVKFTDKYGEICFTLLPFLKPIMVRERLKTEVSSTDEAVRAALGVLPSPAPGSRQVLVAHQFVCYGGVMPEQSESETLSVGGSDAVDADAFDGYDYVALGHLHRPQRVGRDTIRYAGSPLKYHVSEAVGQKSFAVVELGEKGDVRTQLVPLVPLHDLRRIKGGIEDLLTAGKAATEGREDYIAAVIIGEPGMDAAERLRAVYPRLLQVEIRREDFVDEEEFDFTDEPEQDETTLFQTFFHEMTGHALTERQQQLLSRSVEQIRTEPK